MLWLYDPISREGGGGMCGYSNYTLNWRESDGMCCVYIAKKKIIGGLVVFSLKKEKASVVK